MAECSETAGLETTMVQSRDVTAETEQASSQRHRALHLSSAITRQCPSNKDRDSTSPTLTDLDTDSWCPSCVPNSTPAMRHISFPRVHAGTEEILGQPRRRQLTPVQSNASQLPNTCAPPPEATQEPCCTRRVEARLEQAPLIKQSTSLKMATTVKAAAQNTPQFNLRELRQDSHLLALSQNTQSRLVPSSLQLMLYTTKNK